MIIKKSIQYARVIDRQGDCGVFDTMEDAIRLAHEACKEYFKYSPSRKNQIIEAVIKEIKANLKNLSSMTHEDIDINSNDDIFYPSAVGSNNLKMDNCLEARLAANNRDDSYIVHGIITSSTYAIETIIKNTILTLKAGNSVVFSSNENVKHVATYVIQLINNAISAVDGPKNLVVTVKEPSLENNNTMLEDERITMISAIDNLNAEKIAL